MLWGVYPEEKRWPAGETPTGGRARDPSRVVSLFRRRHHAASSEQPVDAGAGWATTRPEVVKGQSGRQRAKLEPRVSMHVARASSSFARGAVCHDRSAGLLLEGHAAGENPPDHSALCRPKMLSSALPGLARARPVPAGEQPARVRFVCSRQREACSVRIRSRDVERKINSSCYSPRCFARGGDRREKNKRARLERLGTPGVPCYAGATAPLVGGHRSSSFSLGDLNQNAGLSRPSRPAAFCLDVDAFTDLQLTGTPCGGSSHPHNMGRRFVLYAGGEIWRSACFLRRDRCPPATRSSAQC